MQKFIISVKEKQTGRDVIPPYVVNSLEGLGCYSERVSQLGLIGIVEKGPFVIACELCVYGRGMGRNRDDNSDFASHTTRGFA